MGKQGSIIVTPFQDETGKIQYMDRYLSPQDLKDINKKLDEIHSQSENNFIAENQQIFSNCVINNNSDRDQENLSLFESTILETISSAARTLAFWMWIYAIMSIIGLIILVIVYPPIK